MRPTTEIDYAFSEVLPLTDITIDRLHSLWIGDKRGVCRTAYGVVRADFYPNGLVFPASIARDVFVQDVKVIGAVGGGVSQWDAHDAMMPGELLSSTRLGRMPWHMDVVRKGGKFAVNFVLLGDQDRRVIPTLVGHADHADPLAPASRMTYMPIGTTPVEPGTTTVVTVAPQWFSFIAKRLLLSRESAAAFELVDVACADGSRPWAISTEPRPGYLFSLPSRTGVPINLRLIKPGENATLTFCNVSKAPARVLGALYGLRLPTEAS